jgi:hypothetical protein
LEVPNPPATITRNRVTYRPTAEDQRTYRQIQGRLIEAEIGRIVGQLSWDVLPAERQATAIRNALNGVSGRTGIRERTANELLRTLSAAEARKRQE